MTASLCAFFMLPSIKAMGYREIGILPILGIFPIISLIAYISYRYTLSKNLTIKFDDKKIFNKKYTFTTSLRYFFSLIDLTMKLAITLLLIILFDKLEEPSAIDHEQIFIPIIFLNVLFLIILILVYKIIFQSLSQIYALVFCRK